LPRETGQHARDPRLHAAVAARRRVAVIGRDHHDILREIHAFQHCAQLAVGARRGRRVLVRARTVVMPVPVHI
jgi:hypothetical protein